MKKNLIMLALAAMSLGACTQVDTGHRGVPVTFGKVTASAYSEGLYWYNPFADSIVQMDVRQQKWESNTQTYTKDVQKADLSFVLNFHLNPDRAHVMYQRVGEDWKANIIPQITAQTIKNEFGRWDAVKVVENRGTVAANIANQLRVLLAKQDVVLDSFDLVNIGYSGDFEQAVEAKQVAIQTAVREQNNTVAVQERSKQAVITAQGTAEALRITSNALESNPKLIQYEAIKAWQATGGKMPSTLIMGEGGKTPPFILGQ